MTAHLTTVGVRIREAADRAYRNAHDIIRVLGTVNAPPTAPGCSIRALAEAEMFAVSLLTELQTAVTLARRANAGPGPVSRFLRLVKGGK